MEKQFRLEWDDIAINLVAWQSNLLTLFGTFRHVTVLPSYGPICSVTPWPIQSEPPRITAQIAAIPNLFVYLSIDVVFMRVRCIPRLACVAGNSSACVATVTSAVSIETVCNKRLYELISNHLR